MLKTCKYCKNEFKTNYSKKIFCERKCKNKWFDSNKEKRKIYNNNQAKNKGCQTCQHCNAKFLYKENRKFCSIKCANTSRAKLDYSDCSSEKEKRAKYWRHYYSQPQNKKKHYELVKNNRHKSNIREKFNKFKSTLKCSQCSEDHFAVLDFHHTNKDAKLSTISQLVCNGNNWQTIMSEVAKCIVLCSNCHRKLHYNEKIETIK